MRPRKNTSRTRAERRESVSDSHHAAASDRKTMPRPVEADAAMAEKSRWEMVTRQIERQTSRAFLDAVTIWGLGEADSARLVGVEPEAFGEWEAGEAPMSEEVLARMTMVALLRTALDISFSPSLSTQWMTLPNSGYPYLGLTPVAYAGEHGWPGLFWVLRQAQGCAVGH